MTTPTGRGLPATGLHLIYTDDGKHMYGYSGGVECDDTETDLINAITGPAPIRAHVVFSYFETTQGDNIRYRIRLGEGGNIDNVILEFTVDHSLAQYQYPASIHVILPHTTRVRLTAQNATDTSSQLNGCMITGKTV